MSESRWQLDDDTIRLGRARVAEIRAQLAERGPTSTRRSPVDESGGSAVSVDGVIQYGASNSVTVRVVAVP